MQEILRLQPMEQQLQQLGLQHSGLDCRPPENIKLMDQKEKWINKKKLNEPFQAKCLLGKS